MRPGKIETTHLNRMAYVYVRQSSLRQVREHTESTERQYQLRERALEYGWPAERIRVVDEDQGRSASGSVDRPGFQAMVGEVALGRVGLVTGIELTRLARNHPDWAQLVDLCRLTNTLIMDESGIYDPVDENDELVLGFKGTMGTMELRVLRRRLWENKLHKARKGKLRFELPFGYAQDGEGSIAFDPDEQVQGAVRRVFEVFRETRSARAVMRRFRDEGLRFPRRDRAGGYAWGALSYSRALDILHNPVYAGAYAFGRHRSLRTVSPAGGRHQRIVRVPRDQWHVLIPDHHPGYITWDEHEKNQQWLRSNQTNRATVEARGAPREGAALLQGLAVCGQCGHRMSVRYTSNGALRARYECNRNRSQYGETACPTIIASPVDTVVRDAFLEALTPHEATLALRVEAEVAIRRTEVDAQWHKQVERAEYEVERARRQYDTVDPSNRLVARTLETRWEERLQELDRTRAEYEVQRARHPSPITEQERQQIRDVLRDVSTVWEAETTQPAERKRLLRFLIEDVVIHARDDPRRYEVTIVWKTGATTKREATRPLSAAQKWRTSPVLLERLRSLAQDGLQDAQIADALNREGLKSPKGHGWTAKLVTWLRGRYRIPSLYRHAPAGALSVQDAARCLGVTSGCVYEWIESGRLQTMPHEKGRRVWVLMPPAEETSGKSTERTGTPNMIAGSAV